VAAKFAEPPHRVSERAFHRLNIGPRLTIGFGVIVLAMLVANAVLLWQFDRARAQAERLRGVDQELIAVLQAHVKLMSFYERLDLLARSENAGLLVNEAQVLRDALVEDRLQTRDALDHLPPAVNLDPTLLPSLESIQEALPAQLYAIIDLAKSTEWEAVRLRLANQVRPLESTSSALVENIGLQVSEQRAQAAFNIDQAQQRILAVVLATAGLTVMFAGFLGWAITRSITRPLARLMEGSAALGSGDFSHRVPAAGNDEISRLGSVFNTMALKLQELYRELQRRETYLAEAQKLSRTGSFGVNSATGKIYWSQETYRIFGYDPETEPTVEMVLERCHPADRSFVQETIGRASTEESAVMDFEHRLLMSDGSIKYLRVVGRSKKEEWGDAQFIGAVTDITERRAAEEALRQTQATLAHVTRVTTLGELTASIAHEINQPLAAAITDSSTCLLWLERNPPDMEEAREAAARSVKDATRAADIISRIRTLFKRGTSQRERVDINDVILEMTVLLRAEADRCSVSIYSDLAADLPTVMADRVQLQQVLMNLMRNGIEAMKSTSGGELVVKSQQGDGGDLLISVSDTGPGVAAQQAERIFDAFFTTKPEGTGMGLAISRSIVESHSGRLWVTPNSGRGTIFHFILPSEEVTK
jgi:PAS domain S-box-containing protein